MKGGFTKGVFMRGARAERGVALIMTLWVIVFLTAIAMNFTFSTRRGSAITRNFKEETMAYFHAVSAYEEALSYLFTDKDLAVDFLDDTGRFWTDVKRESVTGPSERRGYDINVSITDEESRININQLNEKGLRELFEFAGVPEEAVDELVDSLSDWRDPDDLHRLQGGEDDYYKNSELPYTAKNGPLDSVSELLLIKGFKPEYLYGGKDIRALAPILTVYGQGVNVNTAGVDVMSVLGLDSLEIEDVMKQRTRDRGGLRSVPSAIRASGVGLTHSTNFRIDISAKKSGGGHDVKISSVVKRTVTPDGVKLKTVYWKEGY